MENNNVTTKKPTVLPDVNRRQFCSAVGMVGAALAVPTLVAAYSGDEPNEQPAIQPKGRRKAYNLTVGIL